MTATVCGSTGCVTVRELPIVLSEYPSFITAPRAAPFYVVRPWLPPNVG
jgi:hypothetical protein